MRRTAASRRARSAGRAVRGRHTERRISCAAPLVARGSSRGGHPIADWLRGLHDAFLMSRSADPIDRGGKSRMNGVAQLMEMCTPQWGEDITRDFDGAGH